MIKGTPVPTDKGLFHVGDIIKARLYEHGRGGGTAIEEYEGELVYHQHECRFLIRDNETGLSYTLTFSTVELVKAWDDDSIITCYGCQKTVVEHGYCDKDGNGYGECCWDEHADKCESCKEDINNA
jgi:hypothetical protein